MFGSPAGGEAVHRHPAAYKLGAPSLQVHDGAVNPKKHLFAEMS
jgi:hypothetical protein